MIEHICAECKHQYYMISKNHLKCMNENSENYGEDIEPKTTCNKWEGGTQVGWLAFYMLAKDWVDVDE